MTTHYMQCTCSRTPTLGVSGNAPSCYREDGNDNWKRLEPQQNITAQCEWVCRETRLGELHYRSVLGIPGIISREITRRGHDSKVECRLI